MLRVAVAAVIVAFVGNTALAENFTPDQIAVRTIERRAVETAIWGMPWRSVRTKRRPVPAAAGRKVMWHWLPLWSPTPEYVTGRAIVIWRSVIRVGTWLPEP